MTDAASHSNPASPPEPPDNSANKTPLRDLASLFLKLGTTAFGGPAAHIAMMQREVVDKRHWLTGPEFMDMLAASNIIPGPTSTELTIHIGHRRGGWKGLIVAGACFILPAALMCTAIAALYVHFQGLQISVGILYGVKPVVIAVVGQALYRLAKTVVKSILLAGVTALAIGILFAGVNELIVLFGAGILTMAVRAVQLRTMEPTASSYTPILALLKAPAATSAGATMAGAATMATIGAAPLLKVFLIFLKIGAVLFGSGYVLPAFLQTDFVQRYHWLTQPQLLDAIAVGQITPGPVFTTATFIGYVATGSPWGAAVGTLGIFLPAFVFVAISAPLLPRLRKSALAGAFLDGLNASSLALMAVVMIRLTIEALAPAANDGTRHLDFLALALAAASLLLLLWKNVNSAWLVLGGAAIGAMTVYMR